MKTRFKENPSTLINVRENLAPTAKPLRKTWPINIKPGTVRKAMSGADILWPLLCEGVLFGADLHKLLESCDWENSAYVLALNEFLPLTKRWAPRKRALGNYHTFFEKLTCF